MSQQLILLRVVEVAPMGPLQVHCWCGDGWRPVILGEEFSRAFHPECETLEPPENAISLDFPEGARGLLLLPGNWVWSGLENVPKAARRQPNAVGYLVEEHLAEDVEDLHFLCQPRSGDLCSVYAVSRQKMDALCGQLRALQWPLLAALPEYQLLELLESDISLWLDGERAHLWHRGGHGLSLRRESLAPLLESLPVSGQAADAELAEEPGLQLLGAADDLTAAELQSRFGERFSQLEGLAEEQLLARCKAERLANLLSGDYQLVEEGEARIWWHRPALVAGICFALQLALFAGAGGYYKWQSGLARGEAEALFSQMLPNVTPGTDMRRQLEGYLNQTAGGSGNFGRQIQLLSDAWGQHSGGELKLQSLRFDGNRGEMVLQLQTSSMADLDAMVGRLSNGEFTASLLAANELEKGVSGRIRLR